MNLVDVANELATQLGTILNKRAAAFPPDTIDPPCGFVFDAESTYDAAYQRGMDTVTLSLTVLVARTPLRTAWSQIGAFASGSGAKSVKTVIEAGTYTSFDVVTVMSSTVVDAPMAGGTYKAVVFELEIVGSGA